MWPLQAIGTQDLKRNADEEVFHQARKRKVEEPFSLHTATERITVLELELSRRRNELQEKENLIKQMQETSYLKMALAKLLPEDTFHLFEHELDNSGKSASNRR